MPSFLSPLLEAPDGTFVLVNTRTGAVVADRVEAAVDSETRRRGLLGRDGLPAGQALVIAPTNAVHTFFMRFPIDIVFVRRDGTVVKVRDRVGAWRMAAAWRAWGVVEMAAGEVRKSDLRPGDRLAMAIL